MAAYTLTVSTDDLGFGVVEGAIVIVERKRMVAADSYPPINNLVKIKRATNESGLCSFLLNPDDQSTFHAASVFDLAGIQIYNCVFAMPNNNVALQDTITEAEAFQAASYWAAQSQSSATASEASKTLSVAAKVASEAARDAAQSSATSSASSASAASASASSSASSATTATTKASEASASASAASASATSAISSITYQPLEKTGTTYTLEGADCSVGCVTILELSNNSFTDFTLPTPTSLGVTVGKGFNVVITGAYGGQTLAAGSGATLLGSPAFTDTNHCKTVIAWSTTAWRIFG